MLQKQILGLPLTQGVDTKSDPKQVAPGKLLALQNGFFQNPGEIRKRYGYDALPQVVNSTGQPISSGAFVSPFQNQLVVADGQNIYGYSQALGKLGGTYGVFQPINITKEPIYQSTLVDQTPDVAYNASAGLYCYAWSEVNAGDYQAQYIVRDAITGAVVAGPGKASFGGIPKGRGVQVRAIGNFFVIIFGISPDGLLGWSHIDVTNIAAGFSTPAIFAFPSTAGHSPAFDITSFGGKLYVAYNTSTNGINVKTIDTSLTVSGETALGLTGGDHGLATWNDGANLWIAFATTSGGGSIIKGAIYDGALSSVLGATTIATTASHVSHISGVYVTGNQSAIIFDPWEVTTYNQAIWGNTLTVSGAVGTPNILVRSLSLQTKAFIESGKIYFVGTYTSADQFNYFLIQAGSIGSGTQSYSPVVAKIAQGTAAALPQLDPPFCTPSVINIASKVWLFPGSEIGSNGVVGTVAEIMTFTKSVPRKELAYNLHFGGGFVSMFDGLTAAEHGFHVFPEKPTLGEVPASGSIAAGTYEYVVVYSWTDRQGQIHRSAPSVPQQITVVSSGAAVDVNTSSLRLTGKSNVAIEVYRTQNNGTIFYIVGTSTTVSTTDTAGLRDIASDSSIISHAQLYTTGGEVDNIPAPAPLAMTIYRNRIIVIPSDSPRTWWFSKQVVAGGPVEFSDLFVNNIDGYGGDLTACAAMDDKLILFKENAIFVVTGSGPTPNGTNNDFSDPQFITTDVGAISHASVVVMPQGIMFQSHKGICLLDRSLTINPIGMAIEEFNPVEIQPDILDATLYPAFNQVRFLNSTGNAYVFDYLLQQWYLYTNHAGISSCIFENRYVFLKADGTSFKENTNLFTDNGTFVELLLKTSWLQFAQVQGFQRIYYIAILGEYDSPHNLIADVYYDFKTTIAQTTVIAPTNIQPYQWRLFLRQQKCQALQLVLRDSQALPYGEGLRLSDITLLVGVKGGINRLSASRSFA